MSDNIFDFSRYTDKKSSDDGNGGGKSVYTPYVVSVMPPERRLAIWDEKSQVCIKSYSDLKEVEISDHTQMKLIFDDSIFTLKGKNLYSLVILFQEEELAHIGAFIDDGSQQEPEEEETPVIYKITRRSTQPKTKGTFE